MKTSEVFIGIDVSKKTIDLVGLNSSREVCLQPQVIQNSLNSLSKYFTKLIEKLEGKQLLVVFEGTGVYSFNLALALSKLDLKYCEISGLEVKLSKGIARGKSDQSDALQIAEFAVSNVTRIKPSKLPQKTIILLSSLCMCKEIR